MHDFKWFLIKLWIDVLITGAILLAIISMFMDKSHASEVIGQYKFWKYNHNVVAVQDWQVKIAEKIKMPFSTLQYARTIQTQECGDENWFCDNRIDCWPFQINQVHKVENAWCKKKVKEWKQEIIKAKKTGKWKRVLEIRDELYESQLTWLWGRMKDQVKRFEIPTDPFERIRQLCVYHNWSKTKRDYGKKCVLSYKILRQYNISLKK